MTVCSAPGAAVDDLTGKRNLGILRGCPDDEGGYTSRTRTAFPDSFPRLGSRACSGIGRLASSPSAGAQKNVVRLWSYSSRLLRSQDATCPRPVLRGHSSVPGSRGSSGGVPALWLGETGKGGFPCAKTP